MSTFECIFTTQLGLGSAWPKIYGKDHKRDANAAENPLVAVMVKFVCTHFKQLLTPLDKEDRLYDFMLARAQFICQSPGFTKAFQTPLSSKKGKKTRKLGSPMEEAALLNVVITSMTTAFLEMTRFSESVPTSTVVVVPATEMKDMTLVCTCVYVLCVFVSVVCVCLEQSLVCACVSYECMCCMHTLLCAFCACVYLWCFACICVYVLYMCCVCVAWRHVFACALVCAVLRVCVCEL